MITPAWNVLSAACLSNSCSGQLPTPLHKKESHFISYLNLSSFACQQQVYWARDESLLLLNPFPQPPPKYSHLREHARWATAISKHSTYFLWPSKHGHHRWACNIACHVHTVTETQGKKKVMNNFPWPQTREIILICVGRRACAKTPLHTIEEVQKHSEKIPLRGIKPAPLQAHG